MRRMEEAEQEKQYLVTSMTIDTVGRPVVQSSAQAVKIHVQLLCCLRQCMCSELSRN